MKRHLRYMIIGLVLIAMLGIPVAVTAQKSYLHKVTFDQSQAVKQGEEDLAILSTIQLDRLEMSSQELIILVPVLQSLDGTHQQKLSPVFVVGKTRAKILEREARLKNQRSYMTPEPLSITTRHNGTAQMIPYATQVAYQPWMAAASLLIEEWVMGCAECERGHSSFTLIDRIIVPPYNPSYQLAYLVPEAEAVKSREDRYVATVSFRVGREQLEYDYQGNGAVLNDIEAKVSNVVHNKDLTVSDVQVIGYASPEGSATSNKSLSERRAKSIADYLISRVNLPRQKMKVRGYGEDWGMTRDEVAKSALVDKEQVLHIIDTTPDLDARDAKLKQLSGGTTYQAMLKEIYPRIRRTEYTLSYVVRGFDVEEAKQVIKTNPKLLSLNEMYLVAKSYPAGSEDFKEVFDIATRLYPNEPVAIINASAADVEGGNHQAAIQRLHKIEGDARAWNNLAVAYALAGDYQKAQQYFGKASQAGDTHAVHNMSELQKLLDQKEGK